MGTRREICTHAAPQDILKTALSFQLNSYEIDEAILFNNAKICNEISEVI